METFAEIKEQNLSSLWFLQENEKYYAHTHGKQKSTESLTEHIQLVEYYFLKIIALNKLEIIIDKLITKIADTFQANEKLKLFIKKLFYETIIYHDFGKINHQFQQKEGIDNFDDKIQKRRHNEGSNHSSLSAYIFMMHNFKRSEYLSLDDKNQTIADFLISCFSFPIYKHHSSYLSKIDTVYAYSEENLMYMKDFLKEFDLPIGEVEVDDLHDLVNDLENTFKGIKELGLLNIDFFPIFALLKLNYSLLTASDYYATSDYMNGLRFETKNDFGLITQELKEKILNYFANNNKAKYNGELLKKTEYYLSKSLYELEEKSPGNLNVLRQKLGAEVLRNIGIHKNERIFYIEAPTGGGKTNMSMIAIYKMLQIHTEINKVFYVFPFTTLITQTTKAIKDTLGLTENEVAEVHSKAGFQTKNTDNEQDAKYGNERRNQIDNLFINYPLTLLTHIKFFDILKSNKKDTNYILHRLANSVVIIDELQAYSPEHWDKIKYFISKYAELFNIRFIIMSATLPKIDKIKMAFDTHFEPLIPNAKDYLQNPNFAKRVSIKTDLLENRDIDLEKLANILLEKSKNYAHARTDKYKNSIYTIIEFIFKKSASDFFQILNNLEEDSQFFDKIFVLSGTIIEPRRNYIIEYLKDENNRKKKILLITTQVVEAGVDIDMDLGFKNQSLIDSDEQLAGRINRNVKKQNCELWLFRADSAKLIYGKDKRYEVTANFSPDYVNDILTNKKFDKLYEKVFAEIDKQNKSVYKTNFNNYKSFFEKLNFEKIHKEFKLIESENISVFVPEDIDIYCYGVENNFSDNELDFINNNNCLENSKQVSGEKIWELYLSLIQNKANKFSSDIKILNGIMSKFVFSIYKNKEDDLREYCEYNEDHSDFKYFQYLKLRKDVLLEQDGIYCLKGGLNEKLLKGSLGFIF